MSPSPEKSPACLGFLTVVEQVELGLLGGYLVLNAAGRPLEFHCTAPLKPNRAQEILYGPTLRPFLYGEQIGQSLLARSKLRPVVVCTDTETMLAAREFTDLPMVLVLAESSREGEPPGEPFPQARRESPALYAVGESFLLGANRVVSAPHYQTDQHAISSAWPPHANSLNLLEPFARIREALAEAHRAARQAA